MAKTTKMKKQIQNEGKSVSEVPYKTLQKQA